MEYNGMLNNNTNIMKYFIKDTGEEIKEGEMITVRKKFIDGETTITCIASKKTIEMLLACGFIEEREEKKPDTQEELVNSIFLAIEQLQKQVDALQRNTGRQFNALNKKVNGLKGIIGNGK